MVIAGLQQQHQSATTIVNHQHKSATMQTSAEQDNRNAYTRHNMSMSIILNINIAIVAIAILSFHIHTIGSSCKASQQHRLIDSSVRQDQFNSYKQPAFAQYTPTISVVDAITSTGTSNSSRRIRQGKSPTRAISNTDSSRVEAVVSNEPNEHASPDAIIVRDERLFQGGVCHVYQSI